MIRSILALSTALALVLPAAAGSLARSVDPATVSEKRQTPLELYLTVEEAYDALVADPSLVFVDVRSLAEFNFVGHPVVADQNLPLKFMDRDVFDPKKGRYGWTSNPDFVAAVDALMAREGKTKADPVLVMCRSGGRSAMAVRALAEAGYTQVYTVLEGFEGGKDSETGHRTKEGWRNAGLPWSYTIRPEQRYSVPGIASQ